MEIFLVRHGESEANISKTLSNPKTALTANGIKQAEKLAERLSKMTVDLIFASDYVRAMRTAEIINEKCKSVLLTEPLIREKTVPSKSQGQLISSQEHKDYVKQLLLHLADPNWHHSDEENAFDVHERARKFAEKILKRKEKTILVVSHIGFLRSFMATVMLGDLWNPEVSSKVYDFLKHGNTAISRLIIDEKGRFKLTNWNDEAHLAE
jgi:broad specificity phosphatase PhoE